ncbi:MAG TPA: class I SAM-dependent rRNA methyltransferase, partial [Candidatus Eisenbacteria bacterium]|nr:class I SAM-dependent rRNA methyltransferase [Candidatus Eisenbacteria bacterium]
DFSFAIALCRSMPQLFLKKGRESPVLKGHPWIFSGAIEKTAGDAESAGAADVLDSENRWVARGLYSPKSQIRVRVLTWKDEPIDERLFGRRISQALALRENCLGATTNAYRLVNAEGDLLPGLIVDRYRDFLVCQFFTAGIDAFKAAIVRCFCDILSPRGIFEKSEGRVRAEEGLEPASGVLAGEAPPDAMVIEENAFKFVVDVRRGQKTGFFLDQRDNRAFLSLISKGRRILNCFSYSGAFAVYGYGGGAKEVISLDSSKAALELARQNLELNGFPADERTLLRADGFSYLKETDETFDIVVLDPPSLAHKRGDVTAASGGYKFLNLHALRRVNPGGFLLTFSCSPHLSADLFRKIVFGAAVDARRKVTVLKTFGHAVDHPVSLHHPEGEYLKGLLLGTLD